MPYIVRVLRRLMSNAAELSWRVAMIVTALHMGAVFLGLRALGETALTEGLVDFIYYYVVTASSVGYGDMSPTTPGGRLFAALFIIPGAISIFAFVVTKLGAAIYGSVRKIMAGLGDYSTRKGHIVIVGHQPERTDRLIRELDDTQGREIVLVTRRPPDLVGPDVAIVRTEALSRREDLIRAGAEGAKAVVVYAEDDNETMAACLALGAIRRSGHAVAYFMDEERARLVETHCPNFECVVSTAIGQVSRALDDPGAGHLLARLVSRAVDATLHSVVIPEGTPTLRAAELSSAMLTRLQATLIGCRSRNAAEPDLGIHSEARLGAGDALYYVADHRVAPEDLAHVMSEVAAPSTS